MQQFVAKIFRDSDRNAYESYNGVVLEAGTPAPDGLSPGSGGRRYYLGCLFTIRCQLMYESGKPRYPGRSGGPGAYARNSLFDLNDEEPTFRPWSADASLHGPAPARNSGSSVFGLEDLSASPSAAVSTTVPPSTPQGQQQQQRSDPPASAAVVSTAEDFVVWASHEFLRAHLPLLFRRINSSNTNTSSSSGPASPVAVAVVSHPLQSVRASPASPPLGTAAPSAGGGGLPLSYLSPADDASVICVRTADVLRMDVEGHHTTARDRLIHLVTLDVRDYTAARRALSGYSVAGGPLAPGAPPTEDSLLCRVAHHRFVFQSGGMTRFVSAVKTLVPQPVSFPAQACLSASGKGAGPGMAALMGSGSPVAAYGLHREATSVAVAPTAAAAAAAPAPGGSSPLGNWQSKAWGVKWNSSLFAGGAGTAGRRADSVPTEVGSSGRADSRQLEMIERPSQPQEQRPNGEAGFASPAYHSATTSPADRRLEEPPAHSSDSSYVDLGELAGSRRMTPCLRFDEDTHVRLGEGRPRAADPHGLSPLTAEQWHECLTGPDAVLSPAKLEAAREAVYRCGIAPSSAAIRYEVWLFLLGVFPAGSTAADRDRTLAANAAMYATLTAQWTSMLPEQVAHFRGFRERRQAVEKDVTRTDRALALYKEDDSPHLRALQRVLMAHVQFNFDAGYSQGMSDVASVAVLLVHERPKMLCDWAARTRPAGAAQGTEEEKHYAEGNDDSVQSGSRGEEPKSSLHLPQDYDTPPEEEPQTPRALDPGLCEAAAFLCFRAIISERMSQNFSMDLLRGMPVLLRQMQVLVRHFAPDVFRHLGACLSDDMTFTFRWLLMCFRREFSVMEDAMRLWDAVFGCPYTPHYEIIIAVSILVKTGTQIMATLHGCDAVLKFANNLAGNARVEDVLRCAVEFYDDVFAVEVARLESMVRGVHVSAGRPTVEEAVRLCVIVDGDLAP